MPDKMLHIRVDEDLLALIDERVALSGVSRTEWFRRVLRWALSQPIQTVTRTEKV